MNQKAGARNAPALVLTHERRGVDVVVRVVAARTWWSTGARTADARRDRCGEPYDVSKAAVNLLIRELSLGLGPLVRVNGIAPATSKLAEF